MLENIRVIDKENILEEVNNMKLYGYRFVALTCEKEAEGFELTYHFDLNYEMKHLRISVNKEEKIKSISGIYFPAFLIENEYQDLFGLAFENLIIDYKGNLYLSAKAPKAPLLNEKQE